MSEDVKEEKNQSKKAVEKKSKKQKDKKNLKPKRITLSELDKPMSPKQAISEI